jgi:hypothetical protein
MKNPLFALFAAMVLLAVVALAGLVLDPRLITGAPAWLKPLKFAVSTGIYSLSFAWLVGQVGGWPRLTRAVTNVTAATLAIELALIFLQAARGTSSHFNLGTTFDAAVFNVMGLAILALWICQIAVAVVLLRQPFTDPALAWTLRLAIIVTAVGAGIGWLMTVPSAAQIELLRSGAGKLAGAHTIGGADGGPGLFLTNWSRAHGDLRVAHFAGLHALQILPLSSWLASRTRAFADAGRRVLLVWTVSLSYLGLVLLLVWQALRGQSVAAPDGATLTALAIWLAATAAGIIASALAPMRAGSVEAQ